VRDVARGERVRRQKYFLEKIENRKIDDREKRQKSKPGIAGIFDGENGIQKQDDRILSSRQLESPRVGNSPLPASSLSFLLFNRTPCMCPNEATTSTWAEQPR
jgi:hypothetical protein